MRRTVEEFDKKKGCRKYRFKKSGRKPWKLTTEVQKFVLRRLLADRVTKVVTSTTLQADVAKDMPVIVEASCIRKFLEKKGYKWLPRCEKRKYSREQMVERKAFADAVLRLSVADLRKKLCLSLDGVVLSMPPQDETERFNYCWGAEVKMWREVGERNLPRLAGADDFSKQVPLERAIPLWGGISEGGFRSSNVAPHREDQ